MMKLAVDDQVKPAITAEVARALRLLAEAEPEIQDLIKIDTGCVPSGENLKDVLKDMAVETVIQVANSSNGPLDAFVEAVLKFARQVKVAEARPEACTAEKVDPAGTPATATRTADVARALRLLAEAEPEIQALIKIDTGWVPSGESLNDVLKDMAAETIRRMANSSNGSLDAFVEAVLEFARQVKAAEADKEEKPRTDKGEPAASAGAAAARPSAGRDPKSKSTGKAVKP